MTIMKRSKLRLAWTMAAVLPIASGAIIVSAAISITSASMAMAAAPNSTVPSTALDNSSVEPQQWDAMWIWPADAQGAVNYHFWARRTFELDHEPTKAKLFISAQTEYHLYVNGQFITRGPTPCDPAWQSYDTHDVTRLLKVGKNVIAVAAMNEGVGVHWQYAGPGGLIAQLEVTGPTETKYGLGRFQFAPITTVITDTSWKVMTADCYDRRSPRFFWSCGFAETFDASRYDPTWMNVDYDDSNWQPAQVIGPAITRPWQRLVPREIPFLVETPEPPPVAVEKGTFTLKGIHAVRFDAPHWADPKKDFIVIANAQFHSDTDRELALRLESDDAFRCFINDKEVYHQLFNPDEVRTKLWRGYDEFEQVHHGTTLWWYTAPKVQLKKGWNRVEVAMDHGPTGWGFCLAFIDPATDTVVDLPIKSNVEKDRWGYLALPSSGLANSLDDDAIRSREVRSDFFPTETQFDYANGVTDYSMLMHYEDRAKPTSLPVDQPVELKAGEYAIFDLGKVTVGFPHFTMKADAGTVLDVGYSSVAFDDHRIRLSNGGSMKNVDRLRLREGSQEWEPFQRRNGRYVHLSCRAGSVKIQNLGFRRIGYPVEDIATFDCSDATLNRI
ncbi:MAG: family 78 glycoside hydrolase catalytic domain, partial [Phycisphaerae bacterium]|nr:family 78 glycoside hydrolase catalytic domain [Phycisphaerae bacterium]